MTENRTPVQIIVEEGDRLAEAMLAFRSRVQDRLQGQEGPPEVRSMLQALHIPALRERSDTADAEIRQHARWNGEVADYTEAGLQRQAERMRERTAQWFTTLREQLAALVAARLISRAEADIVLQALGAPAASVQSASAVESNGNGTRIEVEFEISGTAVSSRLPGGIYTIEQLQDNAVSQLQNTIHTLVRQAGFTVEDELDVDVSVTQS